MPIGWTWDEFLYRGSAGHYVRGRPPYAPDLALRIAEHLDLDGTGRLLDVGCGPGVLTLPLSHYFAEVVGLDADPGMLAEAERRATESNIRNTRWVQALAEDLPLDLAPIRVATFGQSFHWLDRQKVAATILEMLEPGGYFLHIADDKNPRQNPVELPYSVPPYATITELVRRYLGPVPRAGKGLVRFGSVAGEGAVIASVCFQGPERIVIPATEPLIRDIDQLVSWVYSLSTSAPHLFGESLDQFDDDLRSLLSKNAPHGKFADQPADTVVLIGRKPQT